MKRLIRRNDLTGARLGCAMLLGLTLGCSPPSTAFFSPVGDEQAPASGGTNSEAGSGAGSAAGTAGSSVAAAGSTVGAAGAGAGGSSGTGGGGSSGGDAGGEPISNDAGSGGASDAPALELNLIDDIEGQFPDILDRSGRNGYWFSAHDTSGGACSEVSACDLSAASSHAACVEGAGLTDWGATIALTLRAPFAAYDASQYCGVRFLAKGHGNGWATMISDRVSEPAGGVCFDGGDQSHACFDHLGARFQPGDDWQEFQFLFDDLKVVKGYSGQVRALESEAIYALMFIFQNDAGADFELLVDDVAFLGPGGCGVAQN